MYLLIDFQIGLFDKRDEFLVRINDGHIGYDNFNEFPIMAKFAEIIKDNNFNLEGKYKEYYHRFVI